jgi:hypothetical protein
LLDRETNSLSLIDIIENISMSPVPQSASDEARQGLGGLVADIELVNSWWRSDPLVSESGFQRVRLVFPDGELLVLDESSIVDLAKFSRLRARLRLAGIPVKGPGRYWFCSEYRSIESEPWTEFGRIPLDLEDSSNRNESV